MKNLAFLAAFWYVVGSIVFREVGTGDWLAWTLAVLAAPGILILSVWALLGTPGRPSAAEREAKR